jgi:hypothetical protein
MSHHGQEFHTPHPPTGPPALHLPSMGAMSVGATTLLPSGEPPSPAPLPRHIPHPNALGAHASFASLSHLHRHARITIATFNIWGDELFPARAPRLTAAVQRLRPDVLLLQEVTEKNLSLVEDALPTHASLRQVGADSFSLDGEGCILWDKEVFHLLDSGAEDLSERVNPRRKLLWARLQLAGSATVLFVCTAHLPWTGNEDEVVSGLNPRIGISQHIAEFLTLQQAVHREDIIVLGGDMNDDFHPPRVFRSGAGLVDVFEQLDLPPPVTHPVRPSSDREEMRVRCDVNTCPTRSNANIFVLYCTAKSHFGLDFYPPSGQRDAASSSKGPRALRCIILDRT